MLYKKFMNTLCSLFFIYLGLVGWCDMNESDYLLKRQSEAKLFYASLVSINCPGFDNEIITFNAMGMRHLIRKGSVVRSAKDQIRRFNLLKYAVKILCNPHPIIVHRNEIVRELKNQNGKKVLVKKTADFWSFSEIKDGKFVTVIIRQFPNGTKHFFSIMDTKNKYRKLKFIKKSPKREVL